ncbi:MULTISPECIES: hypothetical protein [unclassified Microcoleus]|uniref:hypothetical protein n=1 Tax=unclassified Microcoleus TaxID=2642155 RepID=UPI002FD4A73B
MTVVIRKREEAIKIIKLFYIPNYNYRFPITNSQLPITDSQVMNNPIIWLHGDCLNPQGPAFQGHPEAPAIWVWDDALIDEWQLSLKRMVFIYECLLDLPVVIRRGNVAAEVIAFAKESGANQVVTAESPSPRFEDICREIRISHPVEVLQPDPFVRYDGYIDLKRFSRYWRVAEKYVF